MCSTQPRPACPKICKDNRQLSRLVGKHIVCFLAQLAWPDLAQPIHISISRRTDRLLAQPSEQVGRHTSVDWQLGQPTLQKARQVIISIEGQLCRQIGRQISSQPSLAEPSPASPLPRLAQPSMQIISRQVGKVMVPPPCSQLSLAEPSPAQLSLAQMQLDNQAGRQVLKQVASLCEPRPTYLPSTFLLMNCLFRGQARQGKPS